MDNEQQIFDDFLKKQQGIIDDNESFKKTLSNIVTDVNEMKGTNARRSMMTNKQQHPAGIEQDFANALMNPETQEKLTKYLNKDIKEFGFNLETKADMTFAGNLPTAAAAVSMVQQGIVYPPAKKMHLRDIMPGVNSLTRDYVYVREDSVTGGASFTPEGSIKPQVSFNLSQQTATTQFLAVTTTISNQLLLDVPGMINYLQFRLLQLLLDQEDLQILTGTGISPNLSGLHTAGNFTAKSTSATIPIEELVASIGQLAALNKKADAIILHPTDYYALIINKASTAGLYSLPAPVTTDENGIVRIAGVPVYWNTAQLVGKFDVADTADGMVLVQRSAPRIEFFTDSVVGAQNKTFVRAELREAFVVYGSTYDIFGTF